jgi:outer membrane cobalamin receptor
MRLSFLALTCLFIVSTLTTEIKAQELSVSGLVIDARTRQAIAEANIYLKNSTTGTTSDNDGYFKLHYPVSLTNDTLIVSFLGYFDYRKPLADHRNNSTIELEPKIFQLDRSITVTADKINLADQEGAHARVVVDMEHIQRLGSSEIGDLFKSVPSVRIEGNDIDGRAIQIRGSDADEVNVYVDGILINNLRFDGVADLSIIPTESIEKLEILKGANLTLLGSGAFGGVVNITTRKSTEPSYFVKVKSGSFHTNYIDGAVTVPLSENMSINYFGQFNRSQPEIEYYTDERYSDVKTTSSEIETVKHNHQLNLNYFTDTGQLTGKLLGYYLDYSKPFWANRYANLISAMDYKGSILGSPEWDMNISHLYSDNRVSRDPVGNSVFHSDYLSQRLSWRVAKKFTFAKTDLQVLSEYHHDELVNKSESVIGGISIPVYDAELYENRIAAAGVFSFHDTLKSKPYISWRTTVGLRGDFLANGDKDFTNNVGIQFSILRSNWKYEPYANYGNNVKYPSLMENAFIRDLTDFYRTDSSSARLLPEYSSSWEIGTNMLYRSGSDWYRSIDFNFAYFRNVFYNKLLRRPFDTLISQSQTGRSFTEGLEASARINRLFTDFTAGLTFMNLYVSDPFIYTYKPEQSASLQFDYGSADGLYFKSLLFFEGESTAWYYDQNDEFQTESIASFYDLDFTIGYLWRLAPLDIDFQFAGYNLLDNSGYKFYSLKKRFLQFSLSVKY